MAQPMAFEALGLAEESVGEEEVRRADLPRRSLACGGSVLVLVGIAFVGGHAWIASPSTEVAVSTRFFGKKFCHKIGEDICRPSIIYDNPEKHYDFGDEIRRDFMSVTKKATLKSTGEECEVMFVDYEQTSRETVMREFDLLDGPAKGISGLPQLKEAYIVRRYLVMVFQPNPGMEVLDLIQKSTWTEDDVAGVVKAILKVLVAAQSSGIINLGVYPFKMTFANKAVRFLNLHGAFKASGKSGPSADGEVLVDTELVAPEILGHFSLRKQTDVWSVGVLTYTMLTGRSPFHKDKDSDDKMTDFLRVSQVKWTWDEHDDISAQAKDFVGKLLKLSPFMRPSPAKLLEHQWLSDEYTSTRQDVNLKAKGDSDLSVGSLLGETSARLQDDSHPIFTSCVLRTFDEDEFDEPDDDGDGTNPNCKN